MHKILKKIELFLSPKKELYFLIKAHTQVTPLRLDTYIEALTTKSSISSKKEKEVTHTNERLEFLGDSVLDLVVSELLFNLYPNFSEGELTNARSRIVNRKSLNKIALNNGIKELLTYCNGSEDYHLHSNVYGNTLEAIIGAINLDHGYAKAKYYIETVLLQSLDIQQRIEKEDNFKSRLIEWGQKNKVDVIFTLVEEVHIPQQKKSFFKSKVSVGDSLSAFGEGNSKKASQQHAAKNILAILDALS